MNCRDSFRDLKRKKGSRFDFPSSQEEQMILYFLFNMQPGFFCPFEFAGFFVSLYLSAAFSMPGA